MIIFVFIFNKLINTISPRLVQTLGCREWGEGGGGMKMCDLQIMQSEAEWGWRRARARDRSASSAIFPVAAVTSVGQSQSPVSSVTRGPVSVSSVLAPVGVCQCPVDLRPQDPRHHRDPVTSDLVTRGQCLAPWWAAGEAASGCAPHIKIL